MAENKVHYDNEKTIIHNKYEDVLGLGKVFESICYVFILVGIPMILAISCCGEWKSFFNIFK